MARRSGHVRILTLARSEAQLLLDEFWQATATLAAQIQLRAAHRWRFALPAEPLDGKLPV